MRDVAPERLATPSVKRTTAASWVEAAAARARRSLRRVSQRALWSVSLLNWVGASRRSSSMRLSMLTEGKGRKPSKRATISVWRRGKVRRMRRQVALSLARSAMNSSRSFMSMIVMARSWFVKAVLSSDCSMSRTTPSQNCTHM